MCIRGYLEAVEHAFEPGLGRFLRRIVFALARWCEQIEQLGSVHRPQARIVLRRCGTSCVAGRVPSLEADIVMAYVVMAGRGPSLKADIVMAYIVMAYIVMAGRGPSLEADVV